MVIITDSHYKMALAPIRDCGQAGLDICACESSEYIKGEEPVGFRSKYVKKTAVLPPISQEEEYLEGLYQLCLDCSAVGKPILLPIGAKTLGLLSKSENFARFSQVTCLCIPTQEQLDLFNDKERVARMAEQLSVPTPKSYGKNIQQELPHLPCIVKPICGEKLGLKAAQRYAIVHTKQELEQKYQHFKKLEGVPPIVQQYIAGDGCGISVLACQGELIDGICHVRLREYPCSGGPSTCCVTREMPLIKEYAAKIIAHTGYTGVAMLEFKQDLDGNFFLLEINPRVWGSYPLTRVSESGFSYNWAALANNLGGGQNMPLQSGFAFRRDKKMQYTPQDFLAGISYARSGRPRQLFSAIVSFFNPYCGDGVLELGDIRASLAYLRSLLRK